MLCSYLIFQEIVYLCISEKSYPRKLAFTYLSDLSNEFSTTYPSSQVLSSNLRPYAFMEFDTFISRTKATYSDTRATQNLDKLNDELRDVTKVMTKNIEDLLYRGDSLERMGEVSSRLREDSLKYRKAAVRINWELLLKQYGPLGGLGLFIIVFLWWRFFWSSGWQVMMVVLNVWEMACSSRMENLALDQYNTTIMPEAVLGN